MMKKEDPWNARALEVLRVLRRLGLTCVGRLILTFDETPRLFVVYSDKESGRVALSVARNGPNKSFVWPHRDQRSLCFGASKTVCVDAFGEALIVGRGQLEGSRMATCACEASGLVCTGSGDGAVRLWRDTTLLWESDSSGHKICGVCFVDDNLLSLDVRGKLVVWPRSCRRRVLQAAVLLQGGGGDVRDRPLASRNSTIAADSALFHDGNKFHARIPVVPVASALTGRYWVVAESTGRTRVYRTDTLAVVSQLVPPSRSHRTPPIVSLASSPCDAYVALCCQGELSVWARRKHVFYLHFQKKTARTAEDDTLALVERSRMDCW